MNVQGTPTVCVCVMLLRHLLHDEPVLYKGDVMEVHLDLSLPAGVVAEHSGRGREDKKHDTQAQMCVLFPHNIKNIDEDG